MAVAQLPFGEGLFLRGCMPYMVGPMVVDVVLEKEDGRAYTFFSSYQKGRYHLRVKIGGKQHYAGRLIAFCFRNPRRVRWREFERRRSGQRHYWECMHLNNELDFRRRNLVVGTSRRNLQDYRRVATLRWRQVLRREEWEGLEGD